MDDCKGPNPESVNRLRVLTMTYRELIIKLLALTDAQLNSDIVVFTPGDSEYRPGTLVIAKHSADLDPNHPVIKIKG